jgi:Xaa-Pro aminopeptidase
MGVQEAERNRLKRLRDAMRARGLDAVFVASDVNRRYLTGFTGTSGYVLVTADRAYLLTDFRYMEQAAAQATAYEVVRHAANVGETVSELLKKLGIRRLGFEQDGLTYGDYQSYAGQWTGIELVPTKNLVEELRMVKDAGELSVMREAAALADAAFRHILGKLAPGVTEREIALELEWHMRQNGASAVSFQTIVASGERSALPHGVAGERPLGKGEFVTLDFGAYYKGYCSDLTRTVVLGKATDRQKEIYGIVLEAQQHALASLKPGMSGKEGDALARNVIAGHGYGEHFGHGTGHGLGMEIHEAPRLSQTSDAVLRPGMVVTVEPGIYISGFGGVRIEDDVVITETGAERLTHSPKELIEID